MNSSLNTACNATNNNKATGPILWFCCLFHISLLLFLSSCQRELAEPCSETIPENCNCQEIPTSPEGISTGWTYQIEGIQYTRPCFNPLFDNQFSYVKVDGVAGTMELKAHNTSTGENTSILILNQAFRSTPQWGSNGWLLFALEDNNIWKIKANGDSLTQLTDSYNCFFPKWNLQGTHFISKCGFGPSFGVLFDTDGNPTDTVTYGSDELSSWNHPIFLGTVVHNIASYYNVVNDSIVFVNLPGEDNSKYGTVWFGDLLVFSSDIGIYSVDIDSEDVSALKRSCNSITYSRPSINSTQSKFIWHRIDTEQLDETTLSSRVRIVHMNVDGTSEEFIDIE